MTPSIRAEPLGSRPVPARRSARSALLAPQPSERLIYSVLGGVTGLFDDADLEALKARNPDAQSRLVASFSKPVLIKLRARLRSPELVQDAFQETFLRVLSYFGSGKTLDKAGSLAGFVHGTCHNVALEFLRAHTRHDQFPENFPEPVAAGLDPERQMVTEERKALVRRILNDLPEKDRLVLKWVFLDEVDKDVVCRKFNINRNYLRVLLYRARQSFLAVVSRERAKGAGA